MIGTSFSSACNRLRNGTEFKSAKPPPPINRWSLSFGDLGCINVSRLTALGFNALIVFESLFPPCFVCCQISVPSLLLRARPLSGVLRFACVSLPPSSDFGETKLPSPRPLLESQRDFLPFLPVPAQPPSPAGICHPQKWLFLGCVAQIVLETAERGCPSRSTFDNSKTRGIRAFI